MGHKTTIDHIEELDLTTIPLSDLYWQFGTGQSLTHGSGRDKKYSYRSGVQTEIGDIREDVWYQAVERIARRDNEEWLVNALTEWKKTKNYANLFATRLRQKALQLYAMRMFDCKAWSDYLPFNRKYRPEAVQVSEIVTVIPVCCKKPGEITRVQLAIAYQNTICCPHCGRCAEFSVVKEQPPWEEV